MIDSHCHLDLPAFEQDWQAVLQRAHLAGVSRVLVPGTQAHLWQRQQTMASLQNAPLPIDITLGLHPYFLNQYDGIVKQTLHALEAQLTSSPPHVVGLGEIGIDSHIDVDMKLQLSVFNGQLQIANNFGLPIVLHHRKSHHLIFEALKKNHFVGTGVIHAFSGSIEVAKAYIDKGFYIGVGGTITYPRAAKTRETMAYLLTHYPSRLLLETDAPDMPINGRQGQRNSPEYLADVVSAMHDIGHGDVAQIIQQTTKNYLALFHPA